MRRPSVRTWLAVLAACAAVAGTGCRALIGVRATVRVGERTQLERLALGERGAVPLQGPLLPLEGDGPPEADLDRLDAEHESLLARLAAWPQPDEEVRAWQIVSLHNRAVIQARMSRTEQSASLLAEALARSRAYRFATLEWQVLMALGELEGGEAGRVRLAQAAELLSDAPLPDRLDYDLESAARRARLHAVLVADALAAGDPEAALGWAARREAVELARAAPPGALSLADGGLAEARSRLLAARRALCRMAPDAPSEARKAEADAAAARLAEVRDALRTDSAAGGLLVPAPADLVALNELLGPDTALVLYEPLGGDQYAAFVLGGPGFAVERLTAPAGLTAGPAGKLFTEGALLAPLAGKLTDDVTRLYLVLPAALSGLAWQDLPLGEATLGERFELAFLGGLSDLPWAFEHKGYGRRSVLACGRAPDGSLPAADPDVTAFDTAAGGAAELAAAAAFADVLWFLDPLEAESHSPGTAYLALPGGLGRLKGVAAADLARYHARAACAGFADVSPGAFDASSFLALRVLTRCLIAGGMPSVVYAAGGTESVGADYWPVFLSAVREGAASAAHRQALGALPADDGAAFRLYGYAGMNEREYAEYSKLEFNDLARSAEAHLAGGRVREAAGDLSELAHMIRVVPLGSESDRARVSAQVQQRLVQCFRELGERAAAVRHQQQLLEALADFEGGAGPLSAVAYQSLGALLTEAEQFREATDAYRQSLALLEGLGRGEDAALVLGELGKSLDRAGDYEVAVETLQQALERYRELQQPAGVAEQHRRIGAILLRRLSNASRAGEHFREAARLYAQAGRPGDVLEADIDLALCHRALGEFDAALEMLGQALESAEQTGLRSTAARALTELGNTRWLRGEYQQALALVGRSNEIARAQDEPFRLNVNHQLLGLIYWELNQPERALRSLAEAVVEAQRAGAPLEVASAHNNRGLVYRRQGRYDEALAAFGQALEIDRRLRSTWGQAYDHRNIGITLRLAGRLAEAERHLERAVALAQEIGDRVNLSKARLALGELRLDQQRPDEARPLLEEALRESRELPLPEVEWRALDALGQMHRAAGDLEAALASFAGAVDVIEGLRAAVKVDELQSGLLANKTDVYANAVGMLLDLGRPEEALRYAERSRARKFLDVLAGRDIDLKSEREQRLYERRQALERRMRSVEEALGRETDPEGRAALAADLDGLHQELADVLLDIRVANPALSGFVTVEVADPAELAQALPADLALVVYYVMPREVAVWVLRGGELTVRRQAVDRDALAGRVREFRIMVQNRELLDDVRAASAGLYDLLIRPVQDLIEGSRLVGIVPHGPLHYLSFAALHDGEAFLVERRPLFYAPSASALRRALEGDAPADKSALEVLAVGNPAVGDPAYELPFTEQEVASLSRDFVHVTAVIRESATEDWVKANVGRFDVIHVGAHGRFDPANPLFSSLMLVPKQDDGLLELHEVTGLSLKARLVVLSACQSGLGDLRAGDELVSLSRAFAYAGTRSILSTLWRVDDVSTALVAKHFYRHYVRHGAAESLRHAQLQVMNDGRHYHPTYWAGVVLTGDYR